MNITSSFINTKPKSSNSTTMSASQSSKQLVLFNNLRNLNDVFEFAKTDINSKYLADNITRNFSSKQKRIKLKELMDEVVILQNESGNLDSSTAYYEELKIDSFDNNTNSTSKKTLMNLLSTPSSSNSQKQIYDLPPLFTEDDNNKDLSDSITINDSNHIPHIQDDQSVLKLDENNVYNDTRTVKKLKDILDLINTNKQSETINQTNSKLFTSLVEFKSADETCDFSNQKSFITKLDEKDELLSNNMNRNMEFLQNCLKAKYIKDIKERNSNQVDTNQSHGDIKKLPHKLIRLSSASLHTSKSSPNLNDTCNSTSSDDSCSETKIKRKLNFYSIGSFNSFSNFKLLEDNSAFNSISSNDSFNESTNPDYKVIELDKETDEISEPKGKGKYPCTICGMRTKKPSMLKVHMRSHNNFRPFNCIWCNISFKTKGNLVKHKKTQGHIKKSLEMGINTDDETNKAPFDINPFMDDNIKFNEEKICFDF